ncbi:transposase (plasmid) [Legionella adelaidensis]|uniref:Transposase n=2 Tax=Legionella adelaidensis TaxID=45056 RepID=A0A0W0R5F1_9GAMM|nr:DDE-type integrase/transposase/recombinase [Legionella adelaidensis]KTC66252.1 transposase [Legionella adelaidensis]VEH84848.1 transposase [Legionella adelaidensis]
MALFRRRFPKGVIVHSDRGSQYCSLQYKQLLNQNRLIGSMSRKGNCWNYAIAESFFHTPKVELIHNDCYQTREQAKLSVFQYIEGYLISKGFILHLTIKLHLSLNVQGKFSESSVH